MWKAVVMIVPRPKPITHIPYLLSAGQIKGLGSALMNATMRYTTKKATTKQARVLII
jgi:hypothetical protein